MKSLLLAVALALGIGFAATGAQAAAVSGNVAAVQSVAKSGNSVVEKTYYRRRHWRGYRYGNRWWQHRRWRHGRWYYY